MYSFVFLLVASWLFSVATAYPGRHYLWVSNGYPGASIWVTVYGDEFVDRKILQTACITSNTFNKFQWDDPGYLNGYYVRAETKMETDCTGDTFSDTTASVVPSQDQTNPAYATLVPGSSGTGTYFKIGELCTEGNCGQIAINLSPGTEYLIQSGVASFNQYLSIDPKNPNCVKGDTSGKCQLVIESHDANEGDVPDSIVWIKQDTPDGFLLTNKATNIAAYVGSGNGAHIQLRPANTVLDQFKSLWTIGGSFPNRVAVRPQHNADQNLNVFGDGPYSSGMPVGTWNWGGGAGNEVWTFIENVPAAQGTPYLIIAGLGLPNMYLSIDPNNPNCVKGDTSGKCALVIEPQPSGISSPPSSLRWWKQDFPSGFILTNQATNMIAWVHDGNGNRVQMLPNTAINQASSLWKIGGNFPNKVAVSPAHDGNQNLNVFGDGPYSAGNPVGTWGWSGGAPNEVWTFQQITAGGLEASESHLEL